MAYMPRERHGGKLARRKVGLLVWDCLNASMITMSRTKMVWSVAHLSKFSGPAFGSCIEATAELGVADF